MNRNDIPELDLANVPGAVPPVVWEQKRKKRRRKQIRSKNN